MYVCTYIFMYLRMKMCFKGLSYPGSARRRRQWRWTRPPTQQWKHHTEQSSNLDNQTRKTNMMCVYMCVCVCTLRLTAPSGLYVCMHVCMHVCTQWWIQCYRYAIDMPWHSQPEKNPGENMAKKCSSMTKAVASKEYPLFSISTLTLLWKYIAHR